MRKGILSNRWFLFAFVIIVAVLIISTTFRIALQEEEALEAIIGVSSSNGRIGQTIQFTSENSTGDIGSYQWHFGDGSGSTEKDPSHTYDLPGLFNVSLVVKGTNGKTANVTRSIGVQRTDVQAEESYGRVVNINPFSSYRYSFQEEIGPNYGNPSISTECSIINGFGEFDYSVEAYIWDENDDLIDVLFLYFRSYTGRSGEIQFQYDVGSTELDPLIENHRTVLYITLYNIQGTWDSAITGYKVTYPME